MKQHLPGTLAKKVFGKCPLCGAALVAHRNNTGIFVACADYPKCSGRPSVVRLTARKGDK